MKTVLIVFGVLFTFAVVIFAIGPQFDRSSSHETQLSSGLVTASTIERPAVRLQLQFVMVENGLAVKSEEQNLGARDYLEASARKSLPDAVVGMKGICSEFHFYQEVQDPDYRIWLVFGTERGESGAIGGVGLYEGIGTKQIAFKMVKSFDSAYFTACGLLRKAEARKTKAPKG